MSTRFLDRPGQSLSVLIERQFPEFVRTDHRHVVAFMEAYYEWMEEQYNPTGATKRILLDQDIDSTLEEFVTYFKREFLTRIPDQILADKRKILKHIKQFYRARGVQKSYRFLFRIMYNADLEFYFPALDMLRASDGNWVKDVSIKVTAIDNNPFDLEGKTIRGLTSGAKAIVEAVRARELAAGYFVYELFLNRASIDGVFHAQEEIADFNLSLQGDILAQVETLVTEIAITNAGDGYYVGEPIEIVSINEEGVEAEAVVSSIDATDFSDPFQLKGTIKTILIANYGSGYSELPDIVFATKPGLPENTATGYAVLGSMTDYPGFFLNDDGKLDELKYLQDSFFYQKFSYVLKVGESLDYYKDVVLDVLHPAGLKLFGQFQHIDVIDLSLKTPEHGALITRTQINEISLILQNAHTYVNLFEESGIQRPTAEILVGGLVEFQSPDILYTSDVELSKRFANFASPGKAIKITNSGGNDGYYRILGTDYDSVLGTAAIEVSAYKPFNVVLQLDPGAGNYNFGERVYQGGTHRLMPAASGNVVYWNDSTGTLVVDNLFGVFLPGSPVVGDIFGASRNLSSVSSIITPHNGELEFLENFEQAFPLGLSERNFEFNKFDYLPSEEPTNPPVSTYQDDGPPVYPPGSAVPGTEMSEMYGVNASYWLSGYANTPIAHIGDWIIGDIVDTPWTKINISSAPVLKSTY